MQPRTKYYIADQMQHFCSFLGVPPQNILRRSGLPEDYFDTDDPGLSPHHMFAIWDAAAAEVKRPGLPVQLGTEMARGHSGSVILAFTCSHSVAAGFDRIALFKPLVGPILLETNRTKTEYTVSIRSTIASLPLPDILAAMDIVFFVELLRHTTGETITPLRATLPNLSEHVSAVQTHIGIPILQTDTVSVTFSANVADLPLVTQNEALWTYYEKDLQRQLEAQAIDTPTSDRLRATLHKMLPSGNHTAQEACKRLNLSKRSLQRHLLSEGTTYQQVLDTTRSELSLHYLRKHDMSVEEISYLLAFRDPNSFYRAFQSWTGMTPAQARAARG